MARTIEGASHIDLWSALPERFTIVTTPGNPGYHRRVALTEVLDEGLVNSIMQEGVKKGIEVGEDGNDLIVIDGRQRVEHCAEANRRLKKVGQPPKKIGFRITRLPPEKWGLLAEHCNIHRPTPVSMQADIARDLESAGNSIQEIADAMGQKKPYVEGLLRLLACDKSVIAAADSGVISPTVARELADMKRDEQKETLAQMIAKGVTKGAQARRAVSSAKKGRGVPDKSEAKKMRPRAEIEAVLDGLQNANGELKAEGRAVRDFVLWQFRLLDAENLCDDVAEILLPDKGEAQVEAKG